jgi:CRISPR-associated endoribonuclease Cas6
LPLIRLGDAIFQVKQLVSHGTETQQWSGNTTYADLAQSTKAETEIRLHFHSPTAFRALTPQGQRTYNHTQVDPVRCYQSWINKWNAFAPIQFDKEEILAYVAEHARVSRSETRTQALNFGRNTEIGWVGTCTFRFESESASNENLLRAVNCLANFAFYCGTGYKTTMGMGQTNRL